MEHHFSQTTTTTLPKILQYPPFILFPFLSTAVSVFFKLGQIMSLLCSKVTQSKNYNPYNDLLASLWPISSNPLTPLTSPTSSFSLLKLHWASLLLILQAGFVHLLFPLPKMSSPYILMPDDLLQRCNPSFPTFLIPLTCFIFFSTGFIYAI